MIRYKIICKLHEWSGREEGEILAWWVNFIRCLLRPKTMLDLWMGKVWKPWENSYTIHGYKFSAFFFEEWCHGKLPSGWFRVVERNGKWLMLEYKKEGYIPIKEAWYKIESLKRKRKRINRIAIK